jgi:hypothetical protein
MAQTRRKEVLNHLPDPAPSPAAVVTTLHASARKRPIELRAHFEPDDIDKDARTLRRCAAVGGLAVCGLMAVAVGTGHPWLGIFALTGVTGVLGLLVAWGNWILDQTGEW